MREYAGLQAAAICLACWLGASATPGSAGWTALSEARRTMELHAAAKCGDGLPSDRAAAAFCVKFEATRRDLHDAVTAEAMALANALLTAKAAGETEYSRVAAAFGTAIAVDPLAPTVFGAHFNRGLVLYRCDPLLCAPAGPLSRQPPHRSPAPSLPPLQVS